MQDWNVFFSGVAQTSASLIGVILAFIISRILSESTDYDQFDKENEFLRIDIKKLKIRCSELDFHLHDSLIVKRDYEFKEMIKKGEFNDLSDDDLLDKLFDYKETIYYPEEVLDIVKEEIENCKQTYQVNGMIMNPMVLADVPEPNYWLNIREFEKDVDDLEFEANILIDKLKIHKKSVLNNINDFKRLSHIMLAFLPIIFLTIIYPLHFLPIENGKFPEISFELMNMVSILLSLKGIFLCILVVLAATIVSYFSYECNKHIKSYKRGLCLIEDKYYSLSEYCDIFSERKILSS